ncbi:MAG: DNA polymerase/3'-5' exonuclease PolX [Phycisphaeraceae bacterium]
MPSNRELADHFELIARVLELTGANRFRVIAYQRAARAIKDLAADLNTLVATPRKLIEIPGVGKDLARQISEFISHGKLKEHDDLIASVPPGVLQMMQIPGVGPKTAATLWHDAGITTLDQLKQKLHTGELADLPRMGEKILANIAHSLAFVESASQRVRLGQAQPVAAWFVQQLRQLSGVQQCDFAGSLRRGRDTIGDIDLLVAVQPDALPGVADAFKKLEPVASVIAAGPTKISVRLASNMQVDLRLIQPDQYGAALAYFTGSKEHNVALRQRAIKKKMRLNEYGLWQGETSVAAASESDIYDKLDLPFIPPELRENRGEIAAAENDTLPQLVTVKDIHCELHAHTRASDGKLTIEELAAVAKERGFHTLAITDHSVSQAQARGLDAHRLEEHIAAVHEARKHIKGITLLAGSEVDILADGKLDYPNSLLKQLDIVVASPHNALSQDPRKATERLLKAIEHPYVNIIGHPTGRLIGKREGLSPDMAALIQAAAETGTALEINSNPWRLDLRDTHARAAIEAGVLLAIDTDAHSANDFDNLRYGVLTARRAWAEPQHIVNCMTAAKLKTWLAQKRKKMG